MNQDQGSRLKKIAVPLMVVALLILGCVQPADSPVEIELPSEPLKWLAEEERPPPEPGGRGGFPSGSRCRRQRGVFESLGYLVWPLPG